MIFYDLKITITILYALTIFSMLTAAVMLWVIKGIKRPFISMFLSRVIFLLAMVLALHYHISHDFEKALFRFAGTWASLILTPLLYFYVLDLVRSRFMNLKLVLWCYIPSILLLLGMIATRFLYEPLPTITTYAQLGNFLYTPEMIIRLLSTIFSIIEGIVLGILGFIALHEYRLRMSSDFSYTEGIRLNWVYVYLGIISIYLVLSHIAMGTTTMNIQLWGLYLFIIFPQVSTILAIRQKDLYMVFPKLFYSPKEEFPENLQSNVSSQNSEKLVTKNDLKERILILLEKEEIYRESNLNAETMCELLGTNRTYLSQLIKNEFNTNFYGLINQYRCQKAMELMKESNLVQQFTLKHIANLAGFKSQNTFINYFKETIGVTPSEWKRNKL